MIDFAHQAEVLLQRIQAATDKYARHQLLVDALRGGEEWRRIAVYLADVHAATAESVGTLGATSAYQRRRLADVCRTAKTMIESGCCGMERRSQPAVVVERLASAETVLRNKEKP